MSPGARSLLTERKDIELVEFPNLISAKDFEAMLKQHAPVHGVALGATRFGETELEASKDMKVVTRIGVGYDAVDVPALTEQLGGDAALARKAARTLAEFRALAHRDAAAVRRLAREVGDNAPVLVPHLDGDVHDVDGLVAVHRHLFASDDERATLLEDSAF
jgi:hypothetical protein